MNSASRKVYILLQSTKIDKKNLPIVLNEIN